LSTRSQYQRIYDDFDWYGDARQDRCPGVRLLPMCRDWLLSPVLDLGCGRGHTVEALREHGFVAEGIDQVAVNPAMRVGDICRPIADVRSFASVTCMDCIEHLTDRELEGLVGNMLQVERQAFSIHNGPSADTGEELHVNRKPFREWERIISETFYIEKKIVIHENQTLYLTTPAASSKPTMIDGSGGHAKDDGA
jgi:SAM-dependent methyltransferase